MQYYKSLVAAIALPLMAIITPAIAQESDLQQQIDRITSVEQVKEELAELIRSSDQCGVGSCFNASRTAVCNTVAMLDVQVNGQILNDMTSVGNPGKIAIAPKDLQLMRDIFSQCKPTTYQYWNYNSILHVYYVPTGAIDRSVRQALGIPLKQKRR
jgi:hypothetical protein